MCQLSQTAIFVRMILWYFPQFGSPCTSNCPKLSWGHESLGQWQCLTPSEHAWALLLLNQCSECVPTLCTKPYGYPYFFLYLTFTPLLLNLLMTSHLGHSLKKLSFKVVSIVIFLSHFVRFSYTGVCFDGLKLSVSDVIVSQKGSNGRENEPKVTYFIVRKGHRLFQL